jgi:cytochrome c biogenesis protein CcmG/thiol:disulfide interchange protein DsbE
VSAHENGDVGSATAVSKDPPAIRRRRRRPWAVAAVTAVVVGAFLLAALGGGRNGSQPAHQAPAFQFPRLDQPDRAVSLSDYRGRPVVVNFWASWCVPCQKEMPAFQAAAADLEGRVAFVGVNEQDLRDSALSFLTKTGVRYPSGFDPEGKMMRAYLLRGLPATAFVSPSGDLLELHLGQINGPDLRATIDRLFGTGR